MSDVFGPMAGTPGTDPWASLGQDDFMDYLGPMLQSDGVNSTLIAGLGTSLQVYGNSSGLQVLWRAGSALVRGVMYRSTGGTLTITANASGTTRVDRVVLRMDRSAKTFAPHVIVGTPGAGEPAMTQAGGGTWDLPLASVTVASGAAGINPGDVADQRQYLPMRLPIANSVVNPLPADGSQGRVYYDTHVGDLLVTDGASWVGVRGTWTYDSGTQGLGTGPHSAGGNYAEYRRVGNTVHLDCLVTTTAENAALFAIAPSVAPSRTKTFPVFNVDDNFVANAPGAGLIPVWAPWGVQVPSAATAAGTPVQLSVPIGRTIAGHTFEFHISYPVG